MEKKEIKVYTKLDNIETNNIFLAIKNEKVIKYNDLDNNKMIIDYENDIIRRENHDYIIAINLKTNCIDIYIKKQRFLIKKEIKTLLIKKTNKVFMTRYKLIDENIINEYYVNF